MNNSFDDKIKEALENFEMPYDASAWAELEKQLPSNPTAGTATGGSATPWKIAALIAVAAIATSVWYFSQKSDTSLQSPQPVVEIQESEAPQISNEPKEVIENAEYERIDKTENQTSAQNASETKILQEESEEIADVDEEIFRSSQPQNQENTESESSNSDNETVVNTVIEAVPIATDETPIIVNFVASVVTACVNQDVSFINQTAAKSANMIWDFGDGSTSLEKDPVHSFVSPGTYTVTLKAEGKTNSVEKTIDIKVNPVPSPVFSADRKLNGYEAIPLYMFSTAIQPTERAIWSFSDGSRISGTKAEHLFRESGQHTAKLTVTNSFGCSTTMDQEFTTEKFNLLAPTAFTPDGDGINETFIPKALSEMGLAFEMTIQNPKTGQMVYRTDNASSPWDGTLNNSGVELASGIYVWTVVLKADVVENRVFTETIHLQR